MRSVGDVGSVATRFGGFRHYIRVDAKLLHAGDESGAFKPEAESSTIWAAHTAIRFLESTDNLVAIDLVEDAIGSLPPVSDWRVLSRRLRLRMTLHFHGRHN